MGTLLVALVSTIVVRIANSSRDHAGPPRRSIAAVEATAEAPAGSLASGATIEARGASEPAPPVQLGEVQQAAHEHGTPQPAMHEGAATRSAPPAEAAPQLDSEAPRFVAPSGR